MLFVYSANGQQCTIIWNS